MFRYIAVFVGGGLGAALRFAVGSLALRFYTGLFPLGTFLINLSGSFLIGLLMTLFLHRPAMHPAWRLFLVVGILGGYTTFSSFEWETFVAFKSEATLIAAMNVLLSVGLGFLGLWAGAIIATRFGLDR
jgi:fluoride exporter